MQKRSLFFFISIIVLSSCTVRVNSVLRSQLENSHVDLKKVQFYNSSAFALERELSKDDTASLKGKIKVKDGKRIEILYIKRMTPAACDTFKIDTLNILFEQGKEKAIPFVCNIYNPDYAIGCPGFSDTPLKIINFTKHHTYKFYGSLKFEGKDYFYGFYFKPHLVVKKKDIRKALKQTRVLKGVKIK